MPKTHLFDNQHSLISRTVRYRTIVSVCKILCNFGAMTTARFKGSPSCLISSITKRWLADNWWMLAIAPAISLMLAAMGDIRFMFVALIMIFTVIPPAVFIIYFYYGVTPAARYSILLHYITADNSGLHITYIAEYENTNVPEPELIGWTDITDASADDKNMYLYLRNPRYSLIIVPVDKLSPVETASGVELSAITGDWLKFSRKNIKLLAQTKKSI